MADGAGQSHLADGRISREPRYFQFGGVQPLPDLEFLCRHHDRPAQSLRPDRLIAARDAGIADTVAQSLQAQRRPTRRAGRRKERPAAMQRVEIFGDDRRIIKRGAVIQHQGRDLQQRIVVGQRGIGAGDGGRGRYPLDPVAQAGLMSQNQDLAHEGRALGGNESSFSFPPRMISNVRSCPCGGAVRRKTSTGSASAMPSAAFTTGKSARRNGFVASSMAMGGRHGRLAGLAQPGDLLGTRRQSLVFRLDGHGETAIRRGIFMGAIDDRLRRQGTQLEQRLPHILRRALQQPPQPSANRVSPQNSRPPRSNQKAIWPRVWPCTSNTLAIWLPKATVSPSPTPRSIPAMRPRSALGPDDGCRARLLKRLVAADMVGMVMGVQDQVERPALAPQHRLDRCGLTRIDHGGLTRSGSCSRKP